jgi:hypothetical protein
MYDTKIYLDLIRCLAGVAGWWHWQDLVGKNLQILYFLRAVNSICDSTESQ